MRKIEVQSPEDIRYLFDNLCRAAKEKIDQHLPPGAADRDDELRKRVEEMLTEVRYCPNHARWLLFFFFYLFLTVLVKLTCGEFLG